MGSLPIVLLHGYSDRGESFSAWRDHFESQGRSTEDVVVASYVSKTNEVTIADLGEAFGRALATSELGERPFDVVVHSTGMLVLREWMRRGPDRRERVKHIIGLAPATWGSPLAHRGNSLLGAVFKGEREWGPDFMEAGQQILLGLELGSPYTWQLAEQDLLGSETWYGHDEATPWPFVFVGTDAYSGLRRAANRPGTDGTVRWSGVGFNSRKFTLDLTVESGGAATLGPWHNIDVPLVFVPGRHHGSILRDPGKDLVTMVDSALAVTSAEQYEQWRSTHAWTLSDAGRYTGGEQWQQFVIRAVDERGGPVTDWFLEFCTVGPDREPTPLEDFDVDVHPFGPDPSYRSFHVDLAKLSGLGSQLVVRLVARSGTDYIAYYGVTPPAVPPPETANPDGEPADPWDAQLQFPPVLECEDTGEASLFYPFTTTLIEVVFNREPLPPDRNRVLWFGARP